MELSLGYVREVTGGDLVRGAEQMAINGISTGSRQVGSGELFFALAGETFDG
ncbi:MAG: UDP-N-acetylmuramoyl-tripeptide--D-alanyl-D-alanine ligase, partial [Syntrophomonadaceae bacterium]|nr:UDP-N-acetylmuramoyl-tripeptide--D-alanyl-D-alanine ligase [Syntrophomonadaceae bacterium]